MATAATNRVSELVVIAELLVLVVSLPLLLVLVVLSRPLFIIAGLLTFAFSTASGVGRPRSQTPSEAP